MLSRLSTEVLQELYPDEALDGDTSRSIRERTVLDRQLRTARRRGYAVSEGESEEGVISLAVPVPDPTGCSTG